MSFSTLSLRRGALLLVLALAAGLLVAAGSATTAVAGTTGDTGEPTVGECRDLTLADIYEESDDSEPIDCSEDHTTRVIAVEELPERLDWDSTEKKLTRAATDICWPAKEAALGRTDKVRAMSAYSYAWFLPNQAEREAGARWVRCDLMLWGGKRVLDLPTDKEPALGGLPHPDGVARCLTRQYAATACTRTHAFRATGSFTVRAKRFPGYDRLVELGQRRCPSQVETRRFYWTWSVVGWPYDRTVVCYTKTRR